MILRTWAAKWGIPFEAIHELECAMGVDSVVSDEFGPDGSESKQQSLIRLEAAGKGISLFRNNVGVLPDATGRPVRYGLANDSKALNKKVKSGDLIGIDPVVITQQHVGHTIGRFISVECKAEGWQFSNSEREAAQLSWAEFVMSKGGRALFANRPGLL